MADQALTTPPSTPPSASMQTTFNITEHYNKLLTTDPTLTPSIAAIESLLSLLSSSPLHTVSETLSLLSTASNTLLSSQRNPLPVSAGTDLFQRYLITSFNQSPLSSQSGSDFTALRNQLISNSKLFVARAKQAKAKIASHALSLLFGPTDDAESRCTVITYGGSRVVSEILRQAVEKNRWFNVIYVSPAASSPSTSPKAASDTKSTSDNSPADKSGSLLQSLQKSHIQAATIPLSSLSLALSTLPTHAATKTSSSTFVLLGTSAVLENGSVVSESGCSLVASVARLHGLPVYVATESFKFVRQFPIGCGEAELQRMGVRQDVLKFDQLGSPASVSRSTNSELSSAETGPGVPGSRGESNEIVDITSPELITGLLTETGMMTPNAVAEELIKLWF